MMRLLVSLLLVQWLTAQPGASCLIRGTVVDAESGKPVVKTRVFAKPHVSAAKPAILRVTGEQGAFCFEHLDAGVYDVVADRPGYLPALYGAKPGGQQGMPLNVDGRNELPPLTFNLLRNATIAGLVLDAGGGPEGARVELDRKAWDKGWSADTVTWTDTDDRGAFRFNGLAPGTYYVSVEGTGNQDLDENGRRTIEARTFHSGSLTFARATPIPVQAGQEIADLVLTIEKVAARHLGGRLSESVKPEQAGSLELTSNTGFGRDEAFRKDGSFSVDGLPPAKYHVRLTSAKFLIDTEVDLTNGDVDGLVLEPEQSFDVRFSTRVEGSAQTGPVQMDALELDKGFERSARPEAGGSHLLQFTPPGIYRLEARRSDRVFVKSLVINGQPVTGAVLDLRHGQPGTVEAILSPNVANIEGRLDRPEGSMPLLATTVVVMDEAKSRTGVVSDQVTVDHTGKFKVESLTPGKYRLFAIEGFEEGAWGSLELAAALGEKSVAVELHESENKSLAVPVITSEEWTAALRRVGM